MVFVVEEGKGFMQSINKKSSMDLLLGKIIQCIGGF